ncbi:MAG: flagellar biosynthetic protein FliO [Betaproteobacteria bacterium]|nr:flagellar biosynthetic protein FliO [Betaproteobacteria bacterium]
MRALPFHAVRAVAWTLLMPCAAFAADAMAAPVGAGSVLQVLLGLAVVLGMVFVAAWAIRRFNPNVAPGSSALRIVAGTAVGNRERVLLLEVNDTWLVVGVAPGRVSQIHSMPRPDNYQVARAPGAPNGFAVWLKQTLERRNHG